MRSGAGMLAVDSCPAGAQSMLLRLRNHPIAIAVLAGAAFALAPAPLSVVAGLFVSMALWVESARLGGPEPSVRRGAKLGFVVGFVFHTLTFSWVLPLFTGHVPIPLPVGIVLATFFFAGHSIVFAVAGAGAEVLHAARVPRSIALAMSMPLAFESIWMMFPYRPSEFAIDFVTFVQLADLSGPGPLDSLVVLAGAATFEGLTSRRRWLVALGVLAVGGPVLYGVRRVPEIEALRDHASIARVGVVQPNVPQRLKDDDRLDIARLDALRSLTATVEAQGADFTVWPETAYPQILSRRLRRDQSGRRGIRHAGLVRGPVLFGALTGDSQCAFRNSAVAMDAHGVVIGIVDKVLLLPFSEEIPFFPWLTFLHPYVPCAGFVAGTQATVIELGGSRIAPLNCYEDLFPWFGREAAQQNPDFLLNITNDAWFFNTAEPAEHHGIARMRAIETRRDLVRVVNTGLTGHIDALGRRVDELPVWTVGTRVFEVRRLAGVESRYVRDGDVFTPFLLWAFVGIVLGAAALRLAREARGA